jgi:hypothetical protein
MSTAEAIVIHDSDDEHSDGSEEAGRFRELHVLAQTAKGPLKDIIGDFTRRTGFFFPLLRG